METRALGDTGQESTMLTFGSIALNWLEQEGANQLVELVLDHGVNHFDVAPTYGDAELKLGPKLRQYREDIFLGCKTQEREYEGAARKIDRSLNRLGIDTIDLYQIHGLEYEDELDTITADGGALDAIREAKAAGKVDHIGLTSHGNPGLILDAIDRIDDLETVMFPLNPVVAGKDGDEYDYEAVLEGGGHRYAGHQGVREGVVATDRRTGRGRPPVRELVRAGRHTRGHPRAVRLRRRPRSRYRRQPRRPEAREDGARCRQSLGGDGRGAPARTHRGSAPR